MIKVRRGNHQRVLLAVLAILIGASPTAWAWGKLGHRASGRIAESLLTPNAKAAVRDLLEPGESLADASTWADEVRRDRKESAPWHYVNVSITLERYDPMFCPPKGCVVSAIAAMRATLGDPLSTKIQKREALRYLAHFVQDLHQPVHVGHRDDRGGNDLQVQFFGKGSNLHRVWDSGILEQYSRDEASWSKDLESLATVENVKAWCRGTVEDWATESLLAAKIAYRGGALKTGEKLGEEYQAMALPIARERLAKASARLASILNGIYP